MIICPHCGATNARSVVFCVQCQTNVHYRKPLPDRSSQPLTAEESALVAKQERAGSILGICCSIVVVTVLILAGLFFGLPNNTEGGYAGMSITFGVMLFGPLLLIPIIGVVLSSKAKSEAEADLCLLRGHRETKPK